MRLVPVGGRIKSASVGLNVFAPGDDNFQAQMKKTRDNPPMPILSAFFPSDRNRMKQMMQGIGFYRPMLKTDQGMGGNFLPFYVNPTLGMTDLSQRQILQELRETFQRLDLRNTDRILGPLLTQSREAEKGRTPFFLIRPALTSSPVIFGRDITEKVTEKVEALLGKVISLAGQMASEARHEFLYFLADAFITMDGEVTIEKLHFPDVGFFITELSLDNSIAREVQGVVNGILSDVFNHVQGLLSSPIVHIITRDEVLARQEDV